MQSLDLREVYVQSNCNAVFLLVIPNSVDVSRKFTYSQNLLYDTLNQETIGLVTSCQETWSGCNDCLAPFISFFPFLLLGTKYNRALASDREAHSSMASNECNCKWKADWRPTRNCTVGSKGNWIWFCTAEHKACNLACNFAQISIDGQQLIIKGVKQCRLD